MRDDRERLADVLAAIDRIRRYVQDDRTRGDIASVDLMSTDYARMADLVNLYKSLRVRFVGFPWRRERLGQAVPR